MLVITRKVNDCLLIELEDGQIVEIKITEISNQVRLGITAPQGCKIWRKEIYQTVQANRQAVEATPVSELRDMMRHLKDGTSK